MNFQSMLKDGYKHLTGLEESVLKNIEACKQLSHITRTSLGPHGALPARSPSEPPPPPIAPRRAMRGATRSCAGSGFWGRQWEQGRAACGDGTHGLPCGHALHLLPLPLPHAPRERRMPFEGRGGRWRWRPTGTHAGGWAVGRA